MRARWQTVVDIDRPTLVVWDFVNDIFQIPRLRGSTLAFRQSPPGPIQIGTTFKGRATILGFEVGLTGTVTGWDPPRESVASLAGGGVRTGWVKESLEATPSGTRLTRSMELELKPLASLGWLLFGRLLTRRWTVASQNIKRILERDTGEDEGAGGSAEPRVKPTGLSVHGTFLFTDIVGSTPLVGVIGDEAWRDLRRWHDATLRRLFEAHHGREVDHAGDGFLVAFDRAEDAIGCAVEIQRTLVEHRRTAGFAPQLRMGIHTGDVQPDGRSFAGAAVHVAARVAASAEGGQILATASAIDEARVRPAGTPEALLLDGVAETVSVAAIAW
jgi:class 3 adenylate cyclase